MLFESKTFRGRQGHFIQQFETVVTYGFILSNFRFKIKLLFPPEKEKYQTFVGVLGHQWLLPTGLDTHFMGRGKRSKEKRKKTKKTGGVGKKQLLDRTS